MVKSTFTFILCLSVYAVSAQSEFITTWKTDNPGVSGIDQITIPIYASNNTDYTIAWGDGENSIIVTGGDVTHDYDSPGTYTIKITGDFPGIYFNGQGDKEKILSVDQWGDFQWSSTQGAFKGCTNLDVVANDVPDISQVVSANQMFFDCPSLIGTSAFNNWDTSNITSMDSMFNGCTLFNQNIGSWDVSQVTQMGALFLGSTAFNQDIGNWDVGNVKNMIFMFSGAASFNQNIGNWNVANVQSMGWMFNGANSFNQNIGGWQVENVTTMTSMFADATAFNQPIGPWNVGKVQAMSQMFYRAETFNQPLSDWDVSAVTNSSHMFFYAFAFNQDIFEWDTSSVNDMSGMFNGATSFNRPIGSWDVSHVTDMSRMFQYAYSFNQDLGNWDVGKVTTMDSMFHLAKDFAHDISTWNIGKVTTMENMFLEVGLSKNNYDTILNSWSNLPEVQNGVVFNAGNSPYCAGKSAKEKLLNEKGWQISDGGEDCYLIDQFVTKWKTDNSGVSNDNQITIPTYPAEIYNYTVVWGDGTFDTGVTGNITHTYSSPGTYTVQISGTFPRIYFNDTAYLQIVGDEEKLESIEQWGKNPWTSMESAFAGCQNLTVNASDMPDLSHLQSLRRMFFWTGYPFNVPNIENWDISNVNDLSGMFDKAQFHQDISAWDVSNVTDMSYLFFSSPFNQDISNWDVSKVTNMSGMFGSGGFRQDVTGWDVSSVTNMDFMFNSTFFDQDISSWNVSNVTSMRHMLSQCSFNQDISNWNVSQVTDMSNIFDDNDLSRENYDKILIAWSQLPSLRYGTTLGGKDVQYCQGKAAREFLMTNWGWNIIDQGENCEEERPFITTWKTDHPGISENNQITIPTNPREVYNYHVDWGDGTSDNNLTEDITHTYDAPGIYQVAITGRFPQIYFNSSEHREFNGKMADAEKILSVDQWGTNRWISMSFAFAGCTHLDIKATDVPDFSKDVRLSGMFLNCNSLEGNVSMTQWDLSPISFTASYMFKGASQFNQPIGQWDVGKVRYLDGMFEAATTFNQNLGSWNIAKAENLNGIFDNSGLSTTNYDNTLIGWSQASSLLTEVKLGAGSIQYCNGESARQNLISNYGWIITDNGKNPHCNLDGDTDGVLDHEDACLNTPAGDSVYENGCTQLSAHNFIVETTGETCPGKNNARIKITSVLSYDFVATINQTAYDFSDSLLIDSLEPGVYDICISLSTQSYQQCYTLEIQGLTELSGKFVRGDNKVDISVEKGSGPYNVSVNNKLVLRTLLSKFSINAKEGDRIEVTTDKICQGSLSEQLDGIPSNAAFPNPTEGEFEIQMAQVQNQVSLSIFNLHSQLISEASYPIIGGTVKLNIEELPEGVYFVKTESPVSKTFKIVKQ